MCELTNKNFYEKYYDIVNDLSTSDFISIDCEFSGLPLDRNSYSLFDRPSVKYEKLRKSMEDFVAFQIGISSFTYIRGETYEVSTYTFYLFPRTYSMLQLIFSCETSSIEFLSNQYFDFNKVFYEGITFLNDAQEEAVKNEINKGNFICKIKSRLNDVSRNTLQTYWDKVCTWRPTAEVGSSIELDVSKVDPFLRYLIVEEIGNRFGDLKVEKQGMEGMKVEKLGTWQKDEGESKQERKEELLRLVLGFKGIMKEIVSMRKPLIGHNMLMDLLMIYKMFFSPLPKRYENFKSEITKLFPTVYDTKVLSYDLKSKIGAKHLWGCSALTHLYRFFKDGRANCLLLDLPVVLDKQLHETKRCENFHDSGFDSYCTGYIFLNMAHMLSMWNDEDKTFRSLSVGHGPTRYFHSVNSAMNCVNLMRSQEGYITLDGPDPKKRAEFILVETKNCRTIDISQLSTMLAKYEMVDVKRLAKNKALIVTSTASISNSLFKQFAGDENFRLSRYSIRRMPSLQVSVAILALLMAGGYVSFLCYKQLKLTQALSTAATKLKNLFQFRRIVSVPFYNLNDFL